MSNDRALRVAFLTLAAGAASARAQSPSTLESVRLHRADARTRAADDLKRCQSEECPALRRLSLLSGVLALSEGDAAQAARQLADYPPPKGLEPFHAYYSGEASFYVGRYADAAAAFEKALEGAPRSLEMRAKARAGEAWLEAGQADKALPYLDEIATLEPSPELLLARADARWALGERDESLADLRTIALKFPAHPHAAQALARLPSDKGVPRFTFNERLLRTRGLLDAGEAARAVLELDAADADKVARGASAQAREALLRAEASFALGKEEDGLKQLDKASRGQRAVAAEAALMRAKRSFRGTDNAKARAEMAKVDKSFPKEPAAEEAGYFVGWLDLQGGRWPDAVKSFESWEKRHPTSHRRDEALWFKSLALLRLERYPEARKALDLLPALFPRSSLVPQARYWSTRASQLQGAPPKEVAERYQEVVRAFAGSFYALLSQARLEELGVPFAPPFPNGVTELAAGQPKVKPPRALELAVALSETGLFRDAGEEVIHRVAEVHSAEDSLQYGAALQAMGEFGGAYLLGIRHLWGAAYTQKKPEALALLYPRAFREAVESECKPRGLDPFFAWSIMRRESAFRPEVVSIADARGLLQLIPRTSSGIAKALEEPEPNPDALYSPQLNIHFATWYLAELFKRFGHPVLVAGAYNASPDAVVRWVETNGKLPLDLFVEMIPYKETRGYVKQVTADYHVYSALYGPPGAQPRLSLAVPVPAEQGVSF